jgi:hypothetical protein
MTFHRIVAGAGALLAVACASSNTVRVPVDDGQTAFREVQKMDCGVYDQRESSLTAGINFSLLWGSATAGPSVTRGQAVGVKWDKSVHAIIVRYKELCSRYNSGALSQAGYDARLAEIDQLYAEAGGIRQNADEVIRRNAHQAFAELDTQTAAADVPAAAASAAPTPAATDAEGVAQAVDALMSKLGAP